MRLRRIRGRRLLFQLVVVGVFGGGRVVQPDRAFLGHAFARPVGTPWKEHYFCTNLC